MFNAHQLVAKMKSNTEVSSVSSCCKQVIASDNYGLSLPAVISPREWEVGWVG